MKLHTEKTVASPTVLAGGGASSDAPSPRVCRTCGLSKPLTDFYIARGRFPHRECKHCTNNRSRTWADRNREIRRDVVRSNYQRRMADPETLEVIRAQKRGWNANNPSKIRAHCEVKRAIQDGILKRPATCQACPSQRRIHAHHDDYDEPLSVIWLCQVCHSARHLVLDDIRARLTLAAYANERIGGAS